MASQIGIFDELRAESHGRELSMRWYRQKVQELLPKPQVRLMIREGIKTQKVTVRPNFGMMNLFYYRPKGAEKLPYYDIFPLVIPLGRRLNNGFVGINFHYLSVPQRWLLLERLSMFQMPSELDSFDSEEGGGDVMALFYPKIKRKRGVKPIVRRYLTKYIKSYFLKIELSEMLIALAIPMERFYTGKWGGKKRYISEKVYRQTRREMLQSA
jgi:hypothetical protein|tara:strand:+ start:19 stop:654 length:636 start_codon:yes stop_codon:yes gene_type:complete